MPVILWIGSDVYCAHGNMEADDNKTHIILLKESTEIHIGDAIFFFCKTPTKEYILLERLWIHKQIIYRFAIYYELKRFTMSSTQKMIN